MTPERLDSPTSDDLDDLVHARIRRSILAVLDTLAPELGFKSSFTENRNQVLRVIIDLVRQGRLPYLPTPADIGKIRGWIADGLYDEEIARVLSRTAPVSGNPPPSAQTAHHPPLRLV